MAEISRYDALKLVDAAFPTDPLVLALGTVVREMLMIAGVKDSHLQVLDSMGLPPAIGLGLALGLERSPKVGKVVVVEGDGGLLMGFSALSTIGRLKPKKLLLLVLDNGTYAATGGQPTGAEATDFAAVARACGFDGRDVDGDDLAAVLEEAKRIDGPLLLRVRITQENRRTGYFLADPVVLGHAFQAYVKRLTE